MELIDELVATTTSVREITGQTYGENLVSVEKYVNGFNDWSHHSIAPYPPIWNTAMFEASILVVTSYFLVSHGFYEAANAILREVLDGFINRLCWDSINDQSHEIHPLIIEEKGRVIEYWEWESGRTEKYISSEKIWELLLNKKHIKNYQDSYDIRKEIKTLLTLLNKYVHGRPESRHMPGRSRTGKINAHFQQSDFDHWFTCLRDIYKFISILSMLSYPELLDMKASENFKSVEPEMINRIKNVISKIESSSSEK